MGQITSLSSNGLQLITFYETSNNLAKYLTAYKCPAGVWTIGIGTTIYPNGKRVAEGDVITADQAYQYFNSDVQGIIETVDSYTPDDINQNQFDALISFAYNVGTSALKASTLLAKVNANLTDPTIQQEFLRWVHGGSPPIVLPGLVKRRISESTLYLNGTLDFI